MPADDQQGIASAVAEISERASLLIREEIELAKAEVSEKITKLLKGIVVGLAAGIFVVTALLFILHGFAWMLYSVVPFDDVFWGYFIVAGVLFLLGGLAGFLASRFFKGGAPPTPELAIDEAKLIRETVTGEPPPPTQPAALEARREVAS